MRNIFMILFILCFRLSAQISEPDGLSIELDLPKGHYEELENLYLSPNADNEFNKNNYSFYTTDFDFEKGKIVKNLTIDNNSDGIKECNLNFDSEGKILIVENFLKNYKMSYQYSENLIIVKKQQYNYKKELSSLSIDSIFYDANKNIINHSYDYKIAKDFGGGYRRIVVEKQYSKVNKLERKFYKSSDHLQNVPYENIRESIFENYKDSIVEKTYSLSETKATTKESISNEKNFVSKSVSFLNKNNQIYRIFKFEKNLVLSNKILISRDASGRITEFRSSVGTSGYFKYNSKGKISYIRETLNDNKEYLKYSCIYDNHDRFISAVGDGGKIKEFDRYYTYDKYGNWISLTFTNTKNTKTRTIIYY